MRWDRALSLSFGAIGAVAASAHLSWAQTPPCNLNLWYPPVPCVPPIELNPDGGGAPKASFAEAAAFAWKEFIALNWPASPQTGQLIGMPGKPQSKRDHPAFYAKFGDPTYAGPLVWETFRSKVEIFPGPGNHPPGYDEADGSGRPPLLLDWGYDVLPEYKYNASPEYEQKHPEAKAKAYPGGLVPACDPSQASDQTPWINLDETDQIGLDNMYAGAAPTSSPGNSAPQLIRFLAKANRQEYRYVAENKWWYEIPQSVTEATVNYYLDKLTKYTSPPTGSSQYVSFYNNTIEVKAGWRPLNDSELASGRFHTQTVRFYEQQGDGACYRDATWGLVALHIIQKTPSAPYFIYATFEQADNLLTSDGTRVEDADGKVLLPAAPATTPQVCLIDPKPAQSSAEGVSTAGTVILTDDPSRCQPAKVAQYCGDPGQRLYYINESPGDPPKVPTGKICVNQRDNPIPDYIIQANKEAHSVIANYLKQNNITSAPWLHYKLVNVQYYPYDKIPDPNIANGSPYTANPPYTATNPPPSSYYLGNIVVETNRSLQMFAGGLPGAPPFVSTEWNANGTPVKNVYYNGSAYNMGGCMGCHGFGAQVRQVQVGATKPGGDFSFILQDGHVDAPEYPAVEKDGRLTTVPRNRHPFW